MKKKYYISTSIAYTSGKPHFGNTYEVVLADAIARYKRFMGYDVYFQTGTDEHGQKIENNAKKSGLNNQEFVDEIALEVRRIWDVMNTSYDRFVRTTNKEHKEKVSKIFEKLYKQGDIYKGIYEGAYCVACESFFTDLQLKDNKCPDCGKEIKRTSEEAYFFKLSNYAKQLEEHINNNPDFIQPESRRNEIINNFIKPGLQDLCVSRTTFDWGVPVEFAPGHIVYVWVDALSNYITFLGYDPDGNHSEEFMKYWPADVHLIGKDILRFHTIYWPIMLMALDLPLPKKIFGHPWILSGEDKMSKSVGNVIYADDVVNKFGVDPVRYYMIHETPFASDGTFTYELLIDRINSDLVNTIGNLVNRTLNMAHQYFGGIVVEPNDLEEIDKKLIDYVLSVPNQIDEKMNQLRVADSLEIIIELFRRANKYVDETMPWVLARSDNDRKRLETVIYNLLETIRFGGVLLQPYLPETSDKILKQLNTHNTLRETLEEFNGLDSGIKLNDPEILFERLDKEKIMRELSE